MRMSVTHQSSDCLHLPIPLLHYYWCLQTLVLSRYEPAHLVLTCILWGKCCSMQSIAWICEVCNSGEETAAHIVFHCPFATSFWDTIQVKLPDNMAPSLLPQLQPPALLPCKHFDTFLLLCCWQLWKRRNNVIFRQQQDSLGTILRAAKEEARLWSYRLPQSDLSVGASWCTLFDSVM